MSPAGELFEFTHNLYKKVDGTHMAHAKILGVWFSMDKRKISPPSSTMLEAFQQAVAGRDIREMSLADLKSLPVKPQNLSPSAWT